MYIYVYFFHYVCIALEIISIDFPTENSIPPYAGAPWG